MEPDEASQVAVEIAVDAGDWPPPAHLKAICETALAAAYETALSNGFRARPDFVVSLLFTDDAAIRRLNRQWRGRDRPTNVLSFPQPTTDSGLLGDIVLACETVRNEATLEDKRLDHHIAHLIVHGFLHLIGYDHENPEDAELMEHLERSGLKKIGIADPYAAAVIEDD